jgi:UDP-glucose 4-epimerase
VARANRFRAVLGSLMAGKTLRILVTGSSGRIGAAVCERIAREAEVVGLDLVPGPWTTALGDVTQPRLVESLVRGVDAIVHVAALLTPHVGIRTAEEFWLVNVEGTRTLLAAALRAGVRRFVLTSTTSVYGCTSRPKDRAIWVTEELAPWPEDIYDLTKLEAERCCREASGRALSVVVLRMSRCFQEPDHLLAFYRLYRGVDRRDVAEGHWLAATVPLTGYETLNLSAETPFRIGDVDLLWSDPWRVLDERAPEVREVFLQRGWDLPERIDRIYVIEKAKRVLGYRPRYGFRSVLDESTAGQGAPAGDERR